jgi:hypothetical protein
MAKARRYSKSAYRFTTRRKTALKKAQLISARKRKGRGKGGALAAVGVLSVAGAGFLGYKFKGSSIQADLKARDFSMTNTRNNLAGRMTPEWKEQNMKENAVSPAAVARKAAPVKPPKANNSTPKPNSSGVTAKSPADLSWGTLGAVVEQKVAGEGKVTDPFGVAQLEKAMDPNVRTTHPLAPSAERIVAYLKEKGFTRETTTYSEIWAMSKMWQAHLRKQGTKISVTTGQEIYKSMLDAMGVKPKWLVEKEMRDAANGGGSGKA